LGWRVVVGGYDEIFAFYYDVLELDYDDFEVLKLVWKWNLLVVEKAFDYECDASACIFVS
jgi:hypothetical protein